MVRSVVEKTKLGAPHFGHRAIDLNPQPGLRPEQKMEQSHDEIMRQPYTV